MPKSAKQRSRKSTAAKATAKKPSQRAAPNPDQKKSGDPGSKQDRVIAMLRSSTGTSIAAIMNATGWQQHSVRGFLAGVVRKKLKLKLESTKVDGTRTYRIESAKSDRPSARHAKRQSA